MASTTTADVPGHEPPRRQRHRLGIHTAVLALASLAAAALPAQQALHFEHLSVEDGLSDNQVNDVLQDPSGFLWIATAAGLNRFDGRAVTTYLHDSRNAHSLPHNDVRQLAIDELGRLWVGTRGGGVARYDAAQDQFEVFRHRPEDPTSLPLDMVECIAADQRGGLWVGLRTNGVAHLDFATGRFRHFATDQADPGALRGSRTGSVLVTRDGTVWIGGMGHGLYRREHDGTFRQYQPTPDDPSSLPDLRVAALHEDPSGRLWIGTVAGLALYLPESDTFRTWTQQSGLAGGMVKGMADTGEGGLWLSIPGIGLQRFDPESGPGLVQKPQPTRRHSLADASTGALFVDRTGVLWIATALGLDRLDPATLAFRAYTTDPDHPSHLPDENLWGIDQASDGSIWIGTTQAGVVRFDPATGAWKSWQHDPADPTSLASNQVFAILVDSADRVWVGTADSGLDLYDPGRDAWIHHRHDPDDPDTIFRDTVYALRETNDGRGLWIGLNNGFDRFDFTSRRFEHPAVIPSDPDGGLLATVFDLVEDPSGTVWVGTFLNGLYEFETNTKTTTKFRPEPDNPESIASQRINVLLMTREGKLWVGTDLGLHRKSGPGNQWQRYGREHGLSSETITSLHEADDGTLWVGTNNGLNRLDPSTDAVQRFFAADGLPYSELGWHGLAGLQDGGLAIATARGFALLDPTKLARDPLPPQVALTRLELFNRPVPLARAVTPPLPPQMIALERPIGLTGAITLDHRQNVFSIAFAGLHFARPEDIRYGYQLEGWDREWLEAQADRPRATYTNLPGGRYTFRVRAATRDGVWSEPTQGLMITVKPPPWKSPLAIAAYVLGLAGAVAAMVLALHRRAEAQRLRAEREAAISHRLRQVDQLRDEFLANTSHELRTPLHGIIGIAESLVDGAGGPLPEQAKQNLGLVVSSGRRLASLVNDILDFSTLRNDTLELARRATDLGPLVDIVLTLSRPLVGAKPVELIDHVPDDLPLADVDEGRVQQILHNLVGNAIKFTKAGSVTVAAHAADGWIEVTVADTGIGIAAADQERIFGSFEQAEGGTAREFGGTGLGLTIARQLVELHGGRLSVESTVGQGSTFRFTVPIAAATDAPREPPAPPTAFVPVVPAVSSPSPSAAPQQPQPPGPRAFSILVVDDDPVNRQVLVNQLSLHDYRVVTASDGEEALELIERERPDLILLDVMMPRMSGYAVCRTLRENLPAAQMPVIYLTARTQVVDVVNGFDSGANDFLTKPVAQGELLARVRTHLDLLDATRNLERKVAERTEELRLANAELERIASLDGLTRIPNRRSLDAAIEHHWADHSRRSASLGFVLFDIDCFKRYNDHFGHQRGDEALVAVAQAAASMLRRPGDLVARYGGEEFAVLLPNSDRAGAEAMANTILVTVRSLGLLPAPGTEAPCVTVSLGVAAIVPLPGSDPAMLVAAADRALYAAKAAGRNRVSVAAD